MFFILLNVTPVIRCSVGPIIKSLSEHGQWNSGKFVENILNEKFQQQINQHFTAYPNLKLVLLFFLDCHRSSSHSVRFFVTVYYFWCYLYSIWINLLLQHIVCIYNLNLCMCECATSRFTR